MWVNMAGYTHDSPADAWPQQVKCTLSGHLLSQLCFPRVDLRVTFIPGIAMIMN